ncbi:FmhB protein of FemAB family involved in peptidoglycan interpeptide biosynthesis [Staphylococcus aureus]|uniref:FmhB protein of FemAB family involved in peptidoglycan interpeptide biosynthesis n=1 Tax=Staphylococcus aureus TaxID=1280 RepID=A0A380DSX7_STAAU|nr:FmhB protein of FemAB family involved in peptidoglycan interpeptide biosynthesis [Staphylococcus aureus]
MLDSAKEIAKAEKAYAIKIDPDVEVDKGTDALQNLKALGLNIKDLKKVYQKTTSNHV